MNEGRYAERLKLGCTTKQTRNTNKKEEVNTRGRGIFDSPPFLKEIQILYQLFIMNR